MAPVILSLEVSEDGKTEVAPVDYFSSHQTWDPDNSRESVRKALLGNFSRNAPDPGVLSLLACFRQGLEAKRSRPELPGTALM